MNANKEPDADGIAIYIEKARSAQKKIADYSQEQVDELVTAVCWSIVRQDHAEQLAKLAVDEGGFGNYNDKVSKIRNRCIGTLRDREEWGHEEWGQVLQSHIFVTHSNKRTCIARYENLC